MIVRNKVFSEDDTNGHDFYGYIFESCKFTGITLKFTNFSRCVFKSCDFSESFLDLASFTECKFPDSKLSSLDFANTSLYACDFDGAVAENCIFQKLKGSNKSALKKFILKSCNFSGARLERSVFVFCDLEDVSFENSDLTGAIFERCSLKGTDFKGAKIEGVGFKDSKISDTILDIDGFVNYGTSQGFKLD